MPRVPESRIVIGPSLTGLDSVSRGTASGIAVTRQAGQISDTLTRFRAQEVERQLDGQLLGATADLTQRVNDLYERYQTDPGDPATMTERFHTEANQIAQDIRANLDDRIHPNFDARVLQTVEPRRVAVRQEAFRRQGDAALADLDRLEQDTARSIAFAPNDLAAQSARQQYEVSLQRQVDLGYLDQQHAEARRESLRKQVAMTEAVDLLSHSPAKLVRRLQDKNDPITKALDPLDSARLSQHAEIQMEVQQARAYRDQLRAEKIADENAYLKLIPKLGDETLTMSDIYESGATAAVQFKMVQALRESLTRRVSQQNERAVNDAYDRIMDPRNPDPITSSDQILDLVTTDNLFARITAQQARSLHEDLLKVQDPNKAEDLRQYHDWVATTRKVITKEQLGVAIDASAQERFLQWRSITQKRFEEGRAAGISVADLLDAGDPGGPGQPKRDPGKNYIGKDIRRFAPDLAAALSDMANKVKAAREGVAPPSEPVTPPGIAPRPASGDPDEWRRQQMELERRQGTTP